MDTSFSGSCVVIVALQVPQTRPSLRDHVHWGLRTEDHPEELPRWVKACLGVVDPSASEVRAKRWERTRVIFAMSLCLNRWTNNTS